MTLALWCLLAVVVAPPVLSVLARSQARRRDYVADPRAYSEGLQGWHRRAHLAHLNALEAVPAIVAAVLVAEFVGAPRAWVDALALAFVVFRALHAAFYLADRPRLRSLVWRMAMLCVVGLFVVAGLYGQR